MSYEFLIPYALDGSLVVPRKSAAAGRMYRCPQCDGPVFLRHGNIYEPHFAHIRSEVPCMLTNETIQHLEAKLSLYNSLRGDISPITISVPRFCLQCKRSHYHITHLLEALGEPHMEYSFDSPSGARFRADIAILYSSGEIRFIIEVLATHKVSRSKAYELRGVPWIEVDAVDILTSQRTAIPVMPRNWGNIMQINQCPMTKHDSAAIPRTSLRKRKVRNRVSLIAGDHNHKWVAERSGIQRCSECRTYMAPSAEDYRDLVEKSRHGTSVWNKEYGMFQAKESMVFKGKWTSLPESALRVSVECPRCLHKYALTHPICGLHVQVKNALSSKPLCSFCESNDTYPELPIGIADCPNCELQCRSIEQVILDSLRHPLDS